MKLKQYLKEAKWLNKTMIGFKIDKSNLKRISDYIESWLKRYDVKYEKTKEPHFSIAQITSKEEKDELMRKMNELNTNISFSPKDLKVFHGANVNKDFIVLEYKPNKEFVDNFKKIEKDFKIRKFPEIKPHVSLFNFEKGVLTDKLIDDMKYSLPKIPKLTAKELGLWNDKFELEAKIKK
jgi:hypothetical protein